MDEKKLNELISSIMPDFTKCVELIEFVKKIRNYSLSSETMASSTNITVYENRINISFKLTL